MQYNGEMPIDASETLTLEDLFAPAVASIGATFPLLARSHQSVLVNALKTGEPGDGFDGAMKALQEACPLLEQFESAGNTTLHCFGTLGAPLFCWGLMQPWAANQSTKTLDAFVGVIAGRLGASRYKARLVSVNALAQLALPILETRLAMSASKKIRVGLMFFEAATKALNNCTKEMDRAIPKGLFASMGRLAFFLDKQELGGKTVLSHWETHLSTWFNPKSSGASTVPLEKAAPVLAGILESDLPTAYKLRAATAMNPGLWLHPLTIELLGMQLPAKESSRLAFLPIEQTGFNVHHVNQKLVRTYCPQLCALLELVASDADWSKKETLRHHVRQMEAKHATFELPMEFEA